ncbi:MAG: TIM44-like domain-containing protein [Kiritimatiellae bacterium]|nr:TIM44-like domain-containing protein [Kiritimatiellia bacterium]
MRKRVTASFARRCVSAVPFKFIALFLFVLAMSCTDVFARAGGGEGYGGGGGSGSGGDSGGGDVFILYLLLNLCIRHPVIGIPLLIIAAVLYFKYGNQLQAKRQSGVIRRGRQMQTNAAVENAVERIHARDPQFTQAQLLSRLKKAFLCVQEDWGRQELRAARAFMSDGMVERFELQFLEQRERGVRNEMRDVRVTDIVLVQAESDALFDTVTVRITASAVDVTKDLKTDARVAGSNGAQAFTEFWSFVRRPGAKTLQGDGLIEGNCPNCGARLQLNESAQCASCGAVVRSGEYDWILTEITQACEWVAVESAAVPGVEALRAADPGLCIQHLEDRAGVMFWRYVAALRQGRIDPMRKMEAESFCAELKKRFEPGPQGRRRYFGECAIGAVETEGVLHGEDYDRAVMGVRWSGAAYSVGTDSAPRREAETHVIYNLFVLIRKHGVKTELSLSLSSAHCPSCGAAVHEEVANACAYCGAILNDGSSDWVLEDILNVYTPEAQALREKIRATDPTVISRRSASALEQAAWMVQVMLADGTIDEKETEALRHFADRRQIPRERLESMMAAGRAGALTVSAPENQEEANEWLDSMAEIVLADGVVSPKEKEAMVNMARRLHFTETDIRQVLARKRTELYQQSKAQVKMHQNKSGEV